MNQTPLTEDEIEQLRDLLKVAEVVKEEAEYKAAVRLVMKTWKRVVIGLAAFIGALLLLRDQMRALWAWFVGA